MCANDVNRIVKDVGNGINDISHAGQNVLGTSGRFFSGLARGDAKKAFGDVKNDLMGEDQAAPAAPGPDQGLTDIKNEQIKNAQQFRSNLPTLKNNMSEGLRVNQNQNMSGQLGQAKESQNRRGLLYGGMAQGQNAGIRSNAASNLAGAISQSNNALENAANTLDAQAIDTAHGIQQNQQAIQDNIYAQAQARLNGQNSMIGNLASTAALAAFI